MRKFTPGNWKYQKYIPEGVTLNGKEYVITNGQNDIALTITEADARLIAAAPEMYRLLDELCKIYKLKATARGEDNEAVFMEALVAEDGAINMAHKLLARIDGKESCNE